MKELTEKVIEFEYEEVRDGGKVICVICNQAFKYSRHLNDDFTGTDKIIREFSNLKTSLRRHLKSEQHCGKVDSTEEKNLIKEKEDLRNTAVGLRLGRIVYHISKRGRPDSDFTSLVQINVSNGADMGDKNHSYYFVTNLLPYLAQTVKKRWKTALANPMAATGCKPPVCVVADKATYQRETRQLIGIITVRTQVLLEGNPEKLCFVWFEKSCS